MHAAVRAHALRSPAPWYLSQRVSECMHKPHCARAAECTSHARIPKRCAHAAQNCATREIVTRGSRFALDNGLVEQLGLRERLVEVAQLFPRESGRELEGADSGRERRHVRAQLQHRVAVVRFDDLAAAVVHADLQRGGRRRLVEHERGRLSRRRRLAATRLGRLAHRSAAAGEGLERRRRRLVRLSRAVDQMHVALGGAVGADELRRHPAAVDVVEKGGVLRVLHVPKRPVVDREAVLPKRDGVLLRALRPLLARGRRAVE
mmetsp:Transcript_1809/g.3724  ORF Transcript_1809/g.3724 Transcript_1809/m.3724 type:complete len:262 (+) Transcript_1809:870-1655(+)